MRLTKNLITKKGLKNCVKRSVSREVKNRAQKIDENYSEQGQIPQIDKKKLVIVSPPCLHSPKFHSYLSQYIYLFFYSQFFFFHNKNNKNSQLGNYGCMGIVDVE